MHRSARIALGLFVVCFVAQPARALTLVSQARQVHARAQFVHGPQPPFPGDVDEHTQSAPDFGPFSASVVAERRSSPLVAHSEATQTSTLGVPAPAQPFETSIDGSAQAYDLNANTPLDLSSLGESLYSLSFDVSEEANYILTALASVSESSQPFSAGGGRILIELVRGASEVIRRLAFDSVTGQGFHQESLDVAGVLLPGSYVLRANAIASAYAYRDPGGPPGATGPYGSGGASYSVDFQVVPEPGTLGSLAAGLLGLAAWRRRRARPPAVAAQLPACFGRNSVSR